MICVTLADESLSGEQVREKLRAEYSFYLFVKWMLESETKYYHTGKYKGKDYSFEFGNGFRSSGCHEII